MNLSGWIYHIICREDQNGVIKRGKTGKCPSTRMIDVDFSEKRLAWDRRLLLTQGIVLWDVI